jgi:ATP-dependent Clp protease protease subunit
MASLIFVSGTKGKRIMTENSFLMTHQMYSMQAGKISELIAQRKFDDLLYERIVQQYVKNSNLDEKQVHDLLLNPNDNWITAQQALEFGLCDKIITSLKEVE